MSTVEYEELWNIAWDQFKLVEFYDGFGTPIWDRSLIDTFEDIERMKRAIDSFNGIEYPTFPLRWLQSLDEYTYLHYVFTALRQDVQLIERVQVLPQTVKRGWVRFAPSWLQSLENYPVAYDAVKHLKRVLAAPANLYVDTLLEWRIENLEDAWEQARSTYQSGHGTFDEDEDRPHFKSINDQLDELWLTFMDPMQYDGIYGSESNHKKRTWMGIFTEIETVYRSADPRDVSGLRLNWAEEGIFTEIELVYRSSEDTLDVPELQLDLDEEDISNGESNLFDELNIAVYILGSMVYFNPDWETTDPGLVYNGLTDLKDAWFNVREWLLDTLHGVEEPQDAEPEDVHYVQPENGNLEYKPDADATPDTAVPHPLRFDHAEEVHRAPATVVPPPSRFHHTESVEEVHWKEAPDTVVPPPPRFDHTEEVQWKRVHDTVVPPPPSFDHVESVKEVHRKRVHDTPVPPPPSFDHAEEVHRKRVHDKELPSWEARGEPGFFTRAMRGNTRSTLQPGHGTFDENEDRLQFKSINDKLDELWLTFMDPRQYNGIFGLESKRARLTPAAWEGIFTEIETIYRSADPRDVLILRLDWAENETTNDKLNRAVRRIATMLYIDPRLNMRNPRLFHTLLQDLKDAWFAARKRLLNTHYGVEEYKNAGPEVVHYVPPERGNLEYESDADG